MTTSAEIDAAFEVAANEVHWSINKLGTIKRMLDAAERIRKCGEPNSSMASHPNGEGDPIAK